MSNPVRQIISDIVSSIRPFDSIEEEHINFVKRWIASGAEIFRGAKPDVPNVHLVSYFMVVDQSKNEFLLVDHRKAELWLPPGGHVEPNEHPQETVKREVKEELGIEAKFLFEEPLFLTVTNTMGKTAPHTDVSLWYVLKGNRNEPLSFDPNEFHRIRWFSKEAIPYERSDPHMKRFIDKVTSKLITLHSYETSATQYAKNTADLHPADDAHRFINTLPKGAKMIDIGCGPGRDAKIFSNHSIDVVGIDFSGKMIEIAKQNAPKCTFFVMDIENMNFPAETFDAAWVNCALLHLPKKNIPSVLRKIYALLKPNGVFYLSVKHSQSDEAIEADSRYEGLEKFWSYFENEELVHLLINANFKIVDVLTSLKSSDYHTHSLIRVFAKKQ